MPHNIKSYPSAAELNIALGAYIADIIAKAIATNNRFTIATSGGSLPKNLEAAFQSCVDKGVNLHTDKWHIFYVDERVVPLDHADSNHAATHAAIYSKPWCQIPSSQIHPINPSLSSIECAKDYENQIRLVFNLQLHGSIPEFDLILLGMGPDGHTASLFPKHPLLQETSKLIADITDSPKPPPTRITFTYSLINQAHNVVFVALGEGKATIVQQVMDNTVPEQEQLPSARIRQAHGTAFPTWFMDTAACSKILV